jgi:hypothetical protein
MKALFAICMIVVAPFVFAVENAAPVPPADSVVKGEVLEVKDVEGYTYLRLKTKDGETWAAVGTAPIKKGAEVTIENVMVMSDFESKSLKKTFPTILFGTLGGAGESSPIQPASARISPVSTVVKGEVLEVKDVESYTYLRLKTKDGETWVAVSRVPVKIGAEVTIENVAVMNNFESKSLKKTFPTILFGTLGGAGTSVPSVGNGIATAQPDIAKASVGGDIHIPKANGENARTVAEIMTKGAELKDKPVLVHGRVVKYNSGIMGKNWIHLRDGSGSAANNTNDVLVTTTNQAQVGDILTVKGVVHTNKDFGAGYSYKVLIEDASLQM